LSESSLGFYLFSYLNLYYIFRNVLQYNHTHADFPLPSEELERYIPKCLVYALLWSFAGDAKLKVRSDLGDFIRSVTTVPLPPSTHIPIIDYEVGKVFRKRKIVWSKKGTVENLKG
jgi:dynein heavy chain 1